MSRRWLTSRPRAQVVIVGGGVIGTSVAYHLTKLGWTDVLLLEQGTLSCGTTWHAAGLVGPLRASESGTRLVQYSAELYASLEAETGLATGYRNVGGVIVARTEDRMVQLRRTAANAAAYDMDCELVSPGAGAGAVAGDAGRRPARRDLAARRRQGQPVRRHPVARARAPGCGAPGSSSGCGSPASTSTDGRRSPGDRGRAPTGATVEAEVVVNCAGQWAKALGDLVGVTGPAALRRALLRRHRGDRGRPPGPADHARPGRLDLLQGGDRRPGRRRLRARGQAVARRPTTCPTRSSSSCSPEDWEHFSVLMDEALLRIPALEETGIRKFYNGPESFTPDNQFLLGEAPGLRGFFVGAGFNSVGIASAGGAGRALAEWIVAGEPQDDLVGGRRTPVRAVARRQRAGCARRVAEVLGLHYAVPWPNRELESGAAAAASRRCTTGVAAAGALFGTRMGWERPNVFGPPGADLDYAWGKPSWLAVVGGRAARLPRRRRGLRPDVVLQVRRRRARTRSPALQWVCAADVDVPVGQLRLHAVPQRPRHLRGRPHRHPHRRRTPSCSSRSSATTVRDLDWLRPARRTRRATSPTSYAVLGVMGPRSRALLSSLSADDWSDEGFPFATVAARARGRRRRSARPG